MIHIHLITLDLYSSFRSWGVNWKKKQKPKAAQWKGSFIFPQFRLHKSLKKKFPHIHHNTSLANLSSSSLADQRLSMWFLPVVMQYFIGHEIVLTIKTKLNLRLLYAGFHCILKLSVWAKIIENDMIYLKPRDWLTSRKILRDLELFAKGSNKEIWKTFKPFDG